MVSPARQGRPAGRVFAGCIGNTSVGLGLFVDGRLRRRWRVATERIGRWNWPRIGADQAVLCSVVPALTGPVARRMAAACGCRPPRQNPAAPHGLSIDYRRPATLGTDRLAAALGARARYPRRHLIVVDCGTATTLTAIRGDGRILGGAILPGLSLWPAELAGRTAQLPHVRPRRPSTVLGRSPAEAIAAGTWFGHAAAVAGVLELLKRAAFPQGGSIRVVATGGNAPAMTGAVRGLTVRPDLVLEGLDAFARRGWPLARRPASLKPRP